MTIVMRVLPTVNTGSLFELYTRTIRNGILQEEEARLTTDYKRQLIAERFASKAAGFYTYKNSSGNSGVQENDTITFYAAIPED